MRKLKLQVQMSLDSYIADVDGNTDWLVWNWGSQWNWDEALKAYFVDFTAASDCVLLSRNMAEEGFINHWTSVAQRSGDPQAAFAKHIAAADKVVFTKTLHEAPWVHSKLAKGDLIEEVNALKQQEGKGLVAYGGASFASSLIAAGLVDEFHLFVNPVVLGKGMSIFNELNSFLNLKLVSARSFACGVLVLVCVPKL